MSLGRVASGGLSGKQMLKVELGAPRGKGKRKKDSVKVGRGGHLATKQI